jgi:DNA (cytosine-5)-methyltransferase 1
MPDKQDRQYFTAVSLFTGAMGLDLGLESCNAFRLLASVEKEEAFRRTIEINRDAGRTSSAEMLVYGDINDLDPWQLLDDIGLAPGELDVLVGGPPCQAFSTAGRRKSVEDARGTLLWRFLDFVKVLQPKVFLMENVRGLVSAAMRHRKISERPEKGGPPLDYDETPGSVLRAFVNELSQGEGSKYRMDAFEVNAVNYGAPQIRERLICIGNRLGKKIDFPAPTHVNPEFLNLEALKPEQLSLMSDSYADGGSQLKPWKTLRDAIGDLKDESPTVLDFSPRKKYYLSLVPPGSNWRSLPPSVQQESMGKAFFARGGRSGWWRRLTFDVPSPTLVTMPNHASTSLCHPTETRALSLREYSRIQEFPDNWHFCGTVAQQYCQVGNAVPVRLGKIAGEVILDVLLDTGNFSSQDLDMELYRLVYLQSHVRTRKWYAKGETFVWNDGQNERDSLYSLPKTSRKERALGKLTA